MSSWIWECVTDSGAELIIEHDGRVMATLFLPDHYASERIVVIDADDFERMCHGFIERMAEWRSRIEVT